MMMRIVRTMASACVFCTIASGQEKGVNPFEDPDLFAAGLKTKGPKTWEVMVEVFSLPFADAASLRREMKGAGEVYRELVKRVDHKKAALEEFLVIKGGVGRKIGTASFEDYRYASEYEPPELPNSVLQAPESEKVAMTFVAPTSPSAFVSKEVGTDLRLVMIDASDEALRVKLDLTRLALVNRISWGQGVSTVEMPKFESHGIGDELDLKKDKTTFLGTMSPPKGEMERKDRRVWLAFATARVPGEKGNETEKR